MTITRSYMCLCVRGAIKNLQGSRAKKSAFTGDDGKPLTRLEAIDALMDELVQGHKVIPMHSGCGNPCKNSCDCAGFDYEDGGCPGYKLEGNSDE